MPSRSYSDENKSAPELEPVSGDTENLYLRRQLQQQQKEFSLKEQTYQRLAAEAHATEKLAQAIGKAINAQPKPMEGREMSHLLARQAAGKDLPHFSGLPEEWPTFSHLFRTSTRDCGFFHAENIGRLQRCLKGKAREAVQLFLSVPKNVPEVMKTLEERFGRPDVIIQQLISKAKSHKQLRADDFEALMEFSTSVGSLVHTMQLMNCTGHMRNPQLKQELVEKLPAIHRLHWGETISNRPPDDICLKDFSVWLTNRARAACAVAGPTRLLVEAPRTRIERLHAAVETRKCDFCGKPDHAVQACQQFSTLAASERWWANAERRCFACLKVHHTARVCQERKVCQKDGCDRYHHHQLHKDRGNSVATQFNGHNNTISPVVLLRILPVRLSGPAGYFDTYAMLDEGSTVTLIDKTVANILGAAGEQDSLVMRWTDSTQHQFLESQRINIGIRGEGEDLFTLKGVQTVDNLDLPVQSVSRERLAAQWTHLTDDRVPSLSTAKPTILIGQDNCQLSVAREVVEGPANSPILTKTKPGWVVHGQLPYVDRNRADGHTVLHIREAPAHDYLHQLVKHSFTTENFGVQVSVKRRVADSVTRAECLLDTTTVRVGERFETGLLWKEDKPSLPHSKDMALRRLHQMERRMAKDSNLAEQYKRKVAEYVGKGCARKLSEEEAAVEPPNTWYLPHFAVFNPNKPGKLRFVFDAAAKAGAVSFNDALLPGPDLLNSLIGVLMKFRQHAIAFGADVKEMFHQVKIRDQDQPAQRFLWRDNAKNAPADVYVMQVMIFRAVSSPASAQFTMRRNAEEHGEEFPEILAATTDNYYMDDYFDSVPSESSAIQKIADTIEVQGRGGFLIRNWISSSSEVLKTVPADLRAAGDVDFKPDTVLPVERTLGLRWDPNQDCFLFIVHPARASPSSHPSKRELLSIVMSVLDPLGFLAAFTVIARILLQDVWLSGIGWDDDIPVELLSRWQEWCRQLLEISKFSLPRAYSPFTAEAPSLTLHVFCDASSKAFAAAAYLRVEYLACVDCTLVASKVRVAPLKPMTIPRLELQAAVLQLVKVTSSHRLGSEIRKQYHWQREERVCAKNL